MAVAVTFGRTYSDGLGILGRSSADHITNRPTLWEDCRPPDNFHTPCLRLAVCAGRHACLMMDDLPQQQAAELIASFEYFSPAGGRAAAKVALDTAAANRDPREPGGERLRLPEDVANACKTALGFGPWPREEPYGPVHDTADDGTDAQHADYPRWTGGGVPRYVRQYYSDLHRFLSDFHNRLLEKCELLAGPAVPSVEAPYQHLFCRSSRVSDGFGSTQSRNLESDFASSLSQTLTGEYYSQPFMEEEFLRCLHIVLPTVCHILFTYVDLKIQRGGAALVFRNRTN